MYQSDHNYKIDDIIVFYFHSGGCGCEVQNEYPITEFVDCKTQKELDLMSGSMITQIIEGEYKEWRNNFDQSWWVKED